MSNPIGATHALNHIVWERPEEVLEPGQIYHVRVHNTVTGQCIYKRESATGQEIEELKRWLTGYKFLTYQPTKPI